MSYIYVVRPPNRFQVEIIEVEKVKVDLLRLKYLVRIGTGRELSRYIYVANSVSYLTMRQSHTPRGARVWCGRPKGQRPIKSLRLSDLSIVRVLFRPAVNER